MTTYYAQTMPGVEEIAWLEIRERLPQAQFESYLFAKEQNGIVVFDYPGNPGDLLDLRTTDDVFLQAINNTELTRGHRDLARITSMVAHGSAFGQAANDYLRYRQFSGPPTYRVIGRQYGQFGYRRSDFVRAVRLGLDKRYPRWKSVADDAQVEFWANLLGSQLLIGLRLSDRTMRHRFNRRVELPAALRPSVAAAMVLLTNPEPDEVFLDPMSGTGTILWERQQFGPYKKILGGDVDPERVDATRQNLQGGRKALPRNIDIRQWDARNLPLYDNSVDKVAVNLPFGRQITGPAEPAKLYPAFLDELQRVVVPGGRIVMLTSEYDLVKEEVRKRPDLTITTGYSMAILGRWGRIYIVDVGPT